MTQNELDIAQFSELLFDIVTDIEKRLALHYVAHDLTPPQFYVLKTLVEYNGRCRIGDIAIAHHLTNATMTGLVKRLEAMTPPLVTREKNAQDGRSVDVIITEAGQAKYDAIEVGLLDQAKTILSLLPEQERKLAIEKVSTYFSMLQQFFPLE